MCLCFLQDSGVQTILQASYESWGFWLHKAARRKERKTDRQKKKDSICFHPQPSRGGLRPVTLRERDSQLLQHTHTHAHARDKNLGKENSRVPLKLNGKIISLLLTIIKKSIPYIQAVKNTWKAPTAKWVQKVLSNMKDFQLLVFKKKKRPTERQSSYQNCQSRPAGQTISSLC